MQIVYKYPLGYGERTVLSLPIGAELLHLGLQNGVPTLWALVEPGAPEQQTRVLRFAGTGHPIEEQIIGHIGSVIDAELGLVWHLFEVKGD